MATPTKPTPVETSPEVPPHFLKLPAIRALTTLSTSEIYRRIAQGRFPKQVLLGPKSSVWLTSEVYAWLRTQIEARGGQQ
jgi:prophage regulatory protein